MLGIFYEMLQIQKEHLIWDKLFFPLLSLSLSETNSSKWLGLWHKLAYRLNHRKDNTWDNWWCKVPNIISSSLDFPVCKHKYFQSRILLFNVCFFFLKLAYPHDWYIYTYTYVDACTCAYRHMCIFMFLCACFARIIICVLQTLWSPIKHSSLW